MSVYKRFALSPNSSQATHIVDFESGTSVLLHGAIFTKDDFLTALLYNKSAGTSSSASLMEYLLKHRFGSDGRLDAYYTVWCLYYGTNRRAASMWLLIALVLSFIGGILAAVEGDINLGLNVGTSILAASSALQWLLIMWGNSYSINS